MSSNSNAYKKIFNNKDKNTVGVGKDEFLARRRFFLEMAQNESDNSVKNAPSKHTESKFKPISTTKSNTTNIKQTFNKFENNQNASTNFSNPKTNSLKSILSQVGRNNQYVSNDEFRSRRKAFEDNQLNDVSQLLPRPLTPSDYNYYGRCSPLLGDRPYSPASERPWSPAYERRGSPTPSFDSEMSFGASEVRLPWERPTQNKKLTTKTSAKEEKKVISNPIIPGSPALSATPITSDEPIAIPITDEIMIDNHNKDELLNEKLKMWYSKVDKEIGKAEE